MILKCVRAKIIPLNMLSILFYFKIGQTNIHYFSYASLKIKDLEVSFFIIHLESCFFLWFYRWPIVLMMVFYLNYTNYSNATEIFKDLDQRSVVNERIMWIKNCLYIYIFYKYEISYNIITFFIRWNRVRKGLNLLKYLNL